MTWHTACGRGCGGGGCTSCFGWPHREENNFEDKSHRGKDNIRIEVKERFDLDSFGSGLWLIMGCCYYNGNETMVFTHWIDSGEGGEEDLLD